MFKNLILLVFLCFVSANAYSVSADTDPLRWRQLVNSGEIGHTKDTVYGWFAGFDTRICVTTYDFRFHPKRDVQVNKCKIVIQPFKTFIEIRKKSRSQGREFFRRP